MQLFISSISVKQCTTIRLQGQCSLLPRELHRLLSRHQGLRNWTTCQCLHARDQGRSDRHQILQVWYCNQCALLNSIIECITYHSLMCKYIKYTCSQQPHNMGLTKHNVGCGTYSSGSKSVNWLRKLRYWTSKINKTVYLLYSALGSKDAQVHGLCSSGSDNM